MIFPDVPKRREWIENRAELAAETRTQLETPLRVSGIRTYDEWARARGYLKDPAAGSQVRAEQGPINWLARDAIEFYTLCILIVSWIIYWRWLA